MHAQEPLAFTPESLSGISAKTTDIHFGKLYAAYVTKRNEIEAQQVATTDEDLGKANQIFSAWRGLKEGETFAANGMVLHQLFFSILGGDGSCDDSLAIKQQILTQWPSWERFVAEFTATGMAARGWAVLAFDPSDGKLHIYAGDAQNQGAVWGVAPLLPCDVYEHGYVIDFGADRKSYIAAFMANVNWSVVNDRFLKARAS